MASFKLIQLTTTTKLLKIDLQLITQTAMSVLALLVLMLSLQFLTLAHGTTQVCTLKGNLPTIKFNDSSADEDDWYIHVNSSNFYILADEMGQVEIILLIIRSINGNNLMGFN